MVTGSRIKRIALMLTSNQTSETLPFHHVPFLNIAMGFSISRLRSVFSRYIQLDSLTVRDGTHKWDGSPQTVELPSIRDTSTQKDPVIVIAFNHRVAQEFVLDHRFLYYILVSLKDEEFAYKLRGRSPQSVVYVVDMDEINRLDVSTRNKLKAWLDYFQSRGNPIIYAQG